MFSDENEHWERARVLPKLWRASKIGPPPSPSSSPSAASFGPARRRTNNHVISAALENVILSKAAAANSRDRQYFVTAVTACHN